MNTLSTSVRDYLKEIFDTQSKLKAITLCRNGILNPNAGKFKLTSLLDLFIFIRSFVLDLNVIVGYQTLLQYFLRHLNERPNESFLDDVDEVILDVLSNKMFYINLY